MTVSILELCERIQNTWLSQAISQSTWGYPVLGAIHVLAIALFGGAVLVAPPVEVRALKNAGLTVVIATGALLFASGAVRYYNSGSFRIKMVLLALIFLNTVQIQKRSAIRAGISLALWAAVIFAARGIAFF